jgi:hypothetical protein
MTAVGPASGDSALTSPEAVLAARVAAVQQAVTVNEMQQAAAAAWMTASEPEAPAANPVGGRPDTL